MKFNLLNLFFFLSLGFTTLCFSQREITLTTERSDYKSGEKILVNFKTSKPLAVKSWIGIFKASVAHGSTGGYISYYYINDKTSSTFNFDAPNETGAYEFRVFEEEYGKEVKAIPFKISSIDPNTLSLTLVSQKIKPSQPFEIKVESKFTMNPRAWVGVFKSKEEDKNNYISYAYISSLQENILKMEAPSAVGSYELRFYAADPGELVKTVSFSVGELDLTGLAFSLNKKEYNPEEDIIIKYNGHVNLTDKAWFGFFNSNATPGGYNQYFDYQYLNPKTGGTIIMKAPTHKGNYQVRLFYADQGPQLLSPIPFLVTSSLDKEHLKNALISEGKIALYGIYFDMDKSIIKQASYPLIKQIAEMLRADPSLKISIEGHTDSQGAPEYNQSLSEKRSAAVRALLTKKYGISTSQLASKGYGESKPLGDNTTSAGRAKNRRVELVKI